MYTRTAKTVAALLIAEALALSSGAAEPQPEVVPPRAAIDYFRGHRPAYPSASRRLYEEGSVVTIIQIDETGHSQCTIDQTSGYPRLDYAVQDWCPKAPVFEPALSNGKPVPYRFKLKYTFGLHDDEADPDGCVLPFDAGRNPDKASLVAEVAALRVAADKTELHKWIERNNRQDVARALYRAIRQDESLSVDEVSAMQEISPETIESLVAAITTRQRATLEEPGGYLDKLDAAYRCRLTTKFTVGELKELKSFYGSALGASASAMNGAILRLAQEFSAPTRRAQDRQFDEEIAKAHAERRAALRQVNR